MTVEFKGCSGGLLSLDGELTPAGEAFFKDRGDPVEFKVVTPESLRTESAVVPQVARINHLSREIQASLDRQSPRAPVSGDHPVVQRALQLLARRAERAITSRK